MIYELPLTQITGKIRIKERLTFSDYGLSIAPLKTIVNERHYIEWQIGYDKIATKYNFHFYGANKKPKRLYELSEIIFDFYKNDIIKRKSLENIKSFLENNTELIEDKAQINRSIFKPENIANTQFLQSFISYPLFIYKDKNFLSEIIIKEKQRAVGIQAMLYFCFPLSMLKNKKEESFLKKSIQSKEKGYLEINKENIDIFLKMLKIFGILSKNHNYDILQILNFMLKN